MIGTNVATIVRYKFNTKAEIQYMYHTRTYIHMWNFIQSYHSLWFTSSTVPTECWLNGPREQESGQVYFSWGPRTGISAHSAKLQNGSACAGICRMICLRRLPPNKQPNYGDKCRREHFPLQCIKKPLRGGFPRRRAGRVVRWGGTEENLGKV